MTKNAEDAGEQGRANTVDFSELLSQPSHQGLGHGESDRGAGHVISSLAGFVRNITARIEY